MSGLGVWGWRWRVQDIVVTGDKVGVGLIGHRELLHGTCLDQLLRKGAEAGECSSGLWAGSACGWARGHSTQRAVPIKGLWTTHPWPRPPRQDVLLLRPTVTTPNHKAGTGSREVPEL